jgi:hypothetical protein
MRDLRLPCLLILISSLYQGACVFVWDGNHKLQAWLPYINRMHNDEPAWHIYVDSIVLDTSHGCFELFITMTKLNKYVFDPSIVFLHQVLDSIRFCFHCFKYFYKSVELDHVKPNLVHENFKIQLIGIIPLEQFKEILLPKVYKKCQSKSSKTWHSLTLKAFFEYMYKV